MDSDNVIIQELTHVCGTSAPRGEDATIACLLSARLAQAREATRITAALAQRLEAEARCLTGVAVRSWIDEVMLHVEDDAATMSMVREALEQSVDDAELYDVTLAAQQRALQVINEGGASLFRVLHAILVTKRLELDSWSVLVAECMRRGRPALAEQCLAAQARTEDRIAAIRRWLDELELARGRPRCDEVSCVCAAR